MGSIAGNLFEQFRVNAWGIYWVTPVIDNSCDPEALTQALFPLQSLLFTANEFQSTAKPQDEGCI